MFTHRTLAVVGVLAATLSLSACAVNGTGMGMGAMAGFVSLPPSMKQRCAPQERLQKLAQNGGNPECERAVSNSRKLFF